MGACFSTWMITVSDNDVNLSASAVNVITINGQLRQFTVPITISLALKQIESESESSSSSFICNSDSLYYDEIIPALDSDYELKPGQIYFVLPYSKLHYPLSASDMAALAVKASVALSSNYKGRRSKSQISPVVAMEVDRHRVSVDSYSAKKKSYSDRPSAGGLGISRSGSMRKLQRYSSRRALFAVRSFRLRLSTIYEGSDLQF